MTGWLQPGSRRCPHANVVHCPLYLASHKATATNVPIYGCVWGEFAEGCAVDRGDIDYAREVARLCETLDGAALVAERISKEREDQSREQRDRNMRLMGLR